MRMVIIIKKTIMGRGHDQVMIEDVNLGVKSWRVRALSTTWDRDMALLRSPARADCLNAEWIRLTEQGKVITITAAAFFRQYPVIIKTFVSPMYLWISPCYRNLTTKHRSITKP